MKKSISSIINRHIGSIKEWFTVTKLIGFAFLLLGIAGLIPGPIPYLPIPGLPDFHENISPELFGIGITVLIIETANERLQSRREKARLIQQLGSQDNGFALEAVRILRTNDWLQNGSLTRVSLVHANLENALLLGADLTGSQLMWANLNGADLRKATLKSSNLMEAKLNKSKLTEATLTEANFFGAEMEKARLLSVNAENIKLPNSQGSDADFSFGNFCRGQMSGATLKKAKFIKANLEECDFSLADLSGAVFSSANLKGANFRSAILSGADFTGANVENADFTNSILDLAKISEEQLAKAKSLEGVSAEHPHIRRYYDSVEAEKEEEKDMQEYFEYESDMNKRADDLTNALRNLSKKETIEESNEHKSSDSDPS